MLAKFSSALAGHLCHLSDWEWLHAAWNYVQGSVFSGIVSGHGQQQGFTRSTMSGPEWLTGGSFGVEASVVAMAVCIPAGAAMMVMAARRGHIMAPRWKRAATGGLSTSAAPKAGQ